MSVIKVAIYPFVLEIEPFVMYQDMLKDIQLSKYYAPSKWYFADRTYNLPNGKSITISEMNENTEFSDVDTLWICTSKEYLDFDTQILPFIKLAVQQGKNIVVSRKLNQNNVDMCEALCKSNNVEFTYSYIGEIVEPNYSSSLIKIQTPIVFVMGIFEGTEKTLTLLHLHKEIADQGYNVHSILTGNNEFGFPGCHPFPEYMFQKDITGREKTISFNHYVRKIEIENHPDLILIAVPGEVMAISDEHGGNYGEMPFYVSNAVHPDYTVLKLFHATYLEKFAVEISDLLQNKFQTPINAFLVSNNAIDGATLTKNTLGIFKTNKKPQELPDIYFYDHINGYGVLLKDDILNTLQGYGEYRKI